MKHIFSASHNQQALWFIQQTLPDSNVFNMGTSLYIYPHVDVKLINSVFDELLVRHSLLRANLSLNKERGLIQEIRETNLPYFECIDASRLSDSEVFAQMQAYSEVPYDLANESLFRVTLFKRTPKLSLLLIGTHHIISDFYSFNIIGREFKQLYFAKLGKSQSPLKPLKSSYSDYCYWLQKQNIEADKGGSKSFWKQYLAEPLPILNLPSSFSKTQSLSFTHQSYQCSISDEIGKKIEKLCQLESVTPFMFYLSCLYVLLFRYSGQNDLVIGVPVSCRDKPEFMDIVGYCINTLPVRQQMRGESIFADLLNQIRNNILEVWRHKNYPLSLISHDALSAREAVTSPIYDVVLNYLVLEESRSINTETNSRNRLMPPPSIQMLGGQFDIQVFIGRKKKSTLIEFRYNGSIFSLEAIERMTGNFVKLLTSFTEDRFQPLNSASLLTPREYLEAINQNSHDKEIIRDIPNNCVELFEQKVREYPRAVAISDNVSALTYESLNAHANQLARLLAKLQIGQGDVVTVLVERTVDMVTAILAILKAGAAYLPLDPAQPVSRLMLIINDAQPSLILTEDHLEQKLDSPSTSNLTLQDAFVQCQHLSKTNLNINFPLSSLAYLIYTSGSTGTPKGTLIHHDALRNFLLSMASKPGIDHTDIVLAITTISFDISILEILLPLVLGARTILLNGSDVHDPRIIWQVAAENNVTIMQATPETYRILLSIDAPVDFKFKIILCGGESLPRILAFRLFDLCDQLWNMYGPTETTIWSALHRVAANDIEGNHKSDNIPVGRPIDNTQLYILDEQLNPVPIGVYGELFIGGQGVSKGYHNKIQLTQTKFIPDHFSQSGNHRLFKTGDQAYFDSNGNVNIVGRFDNQIKLNGFRIELEEIESILKQCMGVEAALVKLVISGDNEKALAAYCVTDNSGASVNEIRQFLRTRLPRYMIPAHLIFLNTLPLLTNGKVDRNALPENIEAKELEISTISPRNNIESKLLKICSRILDVEKISIHDDFFSIGGSSLLAVMFIIEIEQEMGKSLSVATFLENSTIAMLAKSIQSEESANSIKSKTSLVAIRNQSSELPPFIWVHRAPGSAFAYKQLALILKTKQSVFAFQALGLNPEEKPLTRIESMASLYLGELLDLQPEGPYYIGGMCTGGLVVFEMAQMLSKLGKTVAQLLLIETPPPEASKIINNSIKKRVKSRVNRMLNRRYYSFDLASMRRKSHLNKEDENLENRIRKVEQAAFIARDCYKPSFYNGEIINFTSEKTYKEIGQFFNGTSMWNKYAKTVKQIYVPGNHGELLESPNVEKLATEIDGILMPCRTLKTP